MLLGKVLAEAAMQEGKFVTWLPAYGAEMRGGTAHCMLVISDTEIGSPYVDKADTLIIMNRPSLERFKDRIKKKGLLLVNTSLAGQDDYKDVQPARYPFTDMAIKLGNIRIANMVALGCYLAHKSTVGLRSIFEVMAAMAPKGKEELVEINKKALQEGAKLK